MIEKGDMKAVAIAGSLLAAGFCPATPQSLELPTRLPAVEAQVIGDQLQDRLQGYWRQQGVGTRATLAAVGEHTWTTCQNKAVLGNDPANIFYCDQDNKVVVGESAFKKLDYFAAKEGVPPVATLALAVAHETGHEVQDKLAGEKNEAIGKSVELQADCLAGRAIARTMPAIVRFGPKFYHAISPINDVPHHGTTIERTQSFQRGVAGLSC